MNKEKISVFQAVAMMTCLLAGDSILLNPAETAGSDAWLSTLIGWAGGYLIFLMVAAVASLHPGRSLVGIFADCFGPAVSKILGLAYAVLFLLNACLMLQSFGYYEISIELPETPILFIDICFMLVIMMAVQSGIEIIGRMSEIFVVVFTLVVAVTFAAFFIDFHADTFMPVLKDGLGPPLKSGFESAMMPFSESFLSLSILSNLNDRKKIFKVAHLSSLFAGLFLTAITLRNLSVVGVRLSARNLFPSEKIFRLMPGLNIYPMLDLDIIMTGIINISLVLFVSVKTLGEVFSLDEFKALTPPWTGLTVTVGLLLIPDILELESIGRLLPFIDSAVYFAMTILLLLTSLLRTKKAPGETNPPGARAVNKT